MDPEPKYEECQGCGFEFAEDELIEGYCSECYEEHQEGEQV